MPKETAGIDEQKVIDMFTAGEVGIYGRTGPYQVRFNDNRNKEIDAGKTKVKKSTLFYFHSHIMKGKKK